MRNPPIEHLKAWAEQYEETPFYFEHKSEFGKRLVAWSEESAQIKRAFYSVIGRFPESVAVLLKISAGKAPEGKPLWHRYRATVNREHLTNVIKSNEVYI